MTVPGPLSKTSVEVAVPSPLFKLNTLRQKLLLKCTPEKIQNSSGCSNPSFQAQHPVSKIAFEMHSGEKSKQCPLSKTSVEVAVPCPLFKLNTLHFGFWIQNLLLKCTVEKSLNNTLFPTPPLKWLFQALCKKILLKCTVKKSQNNLFWQKYSIEATVPSPLFTLHTALVCHKHSPIYPINYFKCQIELFRTDMMTWLPRNGLLFAEGK